MNKAKLIDKVSERVRIPSTAAKVVVDTIFDSMRESLKQGERIEIRGFETFVMRKYGAYKGRNPKTGKTLDVPPKRLPFFKVGKELKKKVNTMEDKVNEIADPQGRDSLSHNIQIIGRSQRCGMRIR